MNIADIAKMAGVSNAAVSRYFNNGYISKEKREAIHRVVEETGYRPSAQAQTLRTKKTKMIGVIIPRIASFSIGSVVEGIMEVLNDNGYQMLLADTANDPKKELEYLTVFRDKHVDGVILVATIFTAEHKKLLKELKVPVVIIGQRLTGYCCVFHDDYHSIYDITESFIKKDCKKIGYIGAPREDKAVGYNRFRGFIDAIEESGKDDIEYFEAIGDFSSRSGYEKCRDLLEACGDLDGIICATDTMCIGALQYLKEKNYRIPDDLLLSGHGNAFYAQVMTPSLTTVEYSYKESGVSGTKMLLELLGNKDTVVKEIMLGYSIIERESTQQNA